MILKNQTTIRLFFVSFLFVYSLTVSSQVEINPSNWMNFVNGKSNPIVRDTFLLQTFNAAFDDTWEYETTGKTEIFDAKSIGLSDSSDGLSLKLSPGSSVRMKNMEHVSYDSIIISATYAVSQLMKGETMTVTSERDVEPVIDHLYLSPKDNYSALFRQQKEVSLGAKPHNLQIKRDPFNLLVKIGKATGQTKNGCYVIDSVYASGEIKEFSLFTGSGNWDNSGFWTDYPAIRRRKALINGDVLVTNRTICDELYIGNGNVHVNADQRLQTKLISFCSPKASLCSAGDILTKECIVYKSFEEKGKWYFTSFPFDIYPDGIDPVFQLKDDTPNTGGNFLYIKIYNGEKRNVKNNASDNWEVFRVNDIDNNTPIFRKNKGYLIALDEKADTKSISFSSRKEDIPTDFARNGSIAIPVGEKNSQTADDHYGWYLCGNPLPAPLALSDIESNTDLDGYIYVYNGNNFQAYSLNSDYAIPAFSAFFVKAKKDTQIRTVTASPTKSSTLLSIPAYISGKGSMQYTEPLTVNNPSLLPVESRSFIRDNRLLIENLEGNGSLMVTDLTGKLIERVNLNSGNSDIPLSYPSGIYIIDIQTNQYRAQHKFIRRQ